MNAKPITAKTTLQALLADHYAPLLFPGRRLIGKTTPGFMASGIRAFGRYLGHEPRVADCTRANFDGFAEHEAARGLAKSSIVTSLGYLLSLWSYARGQSPEASPTLDDFRLPTRSQVRPAAPRWLAAVAGKAVAR